MRVRAQKRWFGRPKVRTVTVASREQAAESESREQVVTAKYTHLAALPQWAAPVIALIVLLTGGLIYRQVSANPKEKTAPKTGKTQKHPAKSKDKGNKAGSEIVKKQDKPAAQHTAQTKPAAKPKPASIPHHAKPSVPGEPDITKKVERKSENLLKKAQKNAPDILNGQVSGE